MAWLDDVEDCAQIEVEGSLGNVDSWVLLSHEVDVAHRQVLGLINDSSTKNGGLEHYSSKRRKKNLRQETHRGGGARVGNGRLPGGNAPSGELKRASKFLHILEFLD